MKRAVTLATILFLFTCLCSRGASVAPLPEKATLEKIFQAYGGKDKLQSLKAWVVKETAHDARAVTAAQTWCHLPDRIREETVYHVANKDSVSIYVLNGKSGWRKSSRPPYRVRTIAERQIPIDWQRLRSRRFLLTKALELLNPNYKLEFLPDVKIGDRSFLRVKLIYKKYPSQAVFQIWYLDKKTHLLWKSEFRAKGEPASARDHFYSDYSKVGGIPYPRKKTTWRGPVRLSESTFQITLPKRLDPQLFAKPSQLRGLTVPAPRKDDNAKVDKVTLLTRADLEKLQGKWELQVNNNGWQGSIRATITLFPADSKRAGFGRIRYEHQLTKGNLTLRRPLDERGGIFFAGVKHGNRPYLVATTKEATVTPFTRDPVEILPVPFRPNPLPGLSAPFHVQGDQLTLDVAQSAGPFLRPYSDRYYSPANNAGGMDLDWGKLTFRKVNEETKYAFPVVGQIQAVDAQHISYNYGQCYC